MMLDTAPTNEVSGDGDNDVHACMLSDTAMGLLKAMPAMGQDTGQDTLRQACNAMQVSVRHAWTAMHIGSADLPSRSWSAIWNQRSYTSALRLIPI